MSDYCKRDPEMSGLAEDPPQLKREDHEHGFKFRFINKVLPVTCIAPMTLLERLQENFYFKAICKKKQEQKELVIQRSETPGGAVSLDLPCCLIKEGETLKIFFIKSEGNKVTGPKLKVSRSLFIRKNLITFYIWTRGDKNIRKVIKNIQLKSEVKYVCVYAFKGERVKRALRRDSRFVDVIFKNCALSEEGTGEITVMSEPVDRMDGKLFQVIRGESFRTESQESTQENSQESGTLTMGIEENSSTSHSKHAKQESTDVHEEEKKTNKALHLKELPDSQEILQLLRDQFKDLLETLRGRENPKKPLGLQKVFREEFNNSIRIFKRVKIMKELMCLSNNVCQIRDQRGSCGTGFLLFHRFVLTNAHVVNTDWEARNTVAVFGFEDFQTPTLEVRLNRLVVNMKGMNDVGNHLDFALMELETEDVCVGVPEMLSRCWDAPTQGTAVCIIGHPGEEAKQIDPSFVVAKHAAQKAQDEQLGKNQNLLQIMTQQCLYGYEMNDSKIWYNSCFYHGSSGSPVFDEDCRLIGVHTGGHFYHERGLRVSVEYALPIFPVLVEIYKQGVLQSRSDITQHFGNHQNLLEVVKRGNELLLNQR